MIDKLLRGRHILGHLILNTTNNHRHSNLPSPRNPVWVWAGRQSRRSNLLGMLGLGASYDTSVSASTRRSVSQKQPGDSAGPWPKVLAGSLVLKDEGQHAAQLRARGGAQVLLRTSGGAPRASNPTLPPRAPRAPRSDPPLQSPETSPRTCAHLQQPPASADRPTTRLTQTSRISQRTERALLRVVEDRRRFAAVSRRKRTGPHRTGAVTLRVGSQNP